MKPTSINQALAKAQRAFDKASRALPEYEALQEAQLAHGPRQASLLEAQPILRAIAKRQRAPGSPFPDLALFRQEYDALGPNKVRRLFDDMKTIEHCLREVESEPRSEYIEGLRREAAAEANFTAEERRLILSTLHPDANASPERREAAFKAFNAKRGAKPLP
jgi:hypothetical protein